MIAKVFIGIVILSAIALLILSWMQIKTNQQISQVWDALESPPAHQRFNADMVAALPAPVQRYFLHAIAPGTPLATSVKLKMQGQFRLGDDKPWLPMQAQEILTPKGFVSKAVIGRGFQFKGADYYFNNSGRMQFKMWGLIPLVNVDSSDTTRSAIGRLGAEFIWLPSALLPSMGTTWKAIDDNTIQASLQIDGEPVTLTLVIDADGKVLQISLPRWGDRTENKTWAYIPFGSKCEAELHESGFTIPYKMSAGWWFGTERYSEFFQATIERAEFS